jgi:hypothetical protein
MNDAELKLVHRVEELARELIDSGSNLRRGEWPRGRDNRRDMGTIAHELEILLVRLDAIRSNAAVSV